ncbi:hypothetical protein H0H81_004450 [Sphagnurus paluster]|uniref:2-(3-amino-3-carboxypropyl)histidine synthase subunit 2 n=1 Tax=Sphagnurus paluster TaxID=117069 RepID=A0A9P7FSG7_9AGAR|nr:hypothetical protein H0H81_004450 [Sphagnurus paluster]
MTTENTAFAASGEEAINRSLEVQIDTSAQDLLPHQFDEFYEMARTAEEITKGDYKRVALQFPDELLHDSVPLYRRLKAKIGEGRELYVLADTCCVDEVAAQHADADALVHYGHACMTQTSRLPVIYVFGQKPFHVSACVNSVVDFFSRHIEIQKDEDSPTRLDAILLKHDVGYTHAMEGLFHHLQNALNTIGIKILYERLSKITLPGAPFPGSDALDIPSSQSEARQGVDSSEASKSVLLYIGGESLTLTNLLMTHGLSEVFLYDPTTFKTSLASAKTNRLLMRRYAAVQRARDADVFGILVGTLGVASYLPLIKHLRALLSRNRKKSYTISVGKLNPSKLANFLEIECFVLVACPENSIIEAKEFLRPIVTPFELEVALQAVPSWTGRYVLDFEHLLINQQQKPELTQSGDKNESDDPDRPVFSLVTGTYRHMRRYGGEALQEQNTNGTDSAVVLRNHDDAVAKLASSAAGTSAFWDASTFVAEE